jgi:hypothetical protein
MSIALSLGNNLTTGGVFKASAVNNTSCNNITDFAGLAGGATLNLISTQTASASSSISFTTGIDSTYDEYVFKFINCHPSSASQFSFNLSTDGGSNYNVTKTTTMFRTQHNESGTNANISYESGNDLAQSTAYQPVSELTAIDNDASISGTLHLFQPSSTTYVKHFISHTNTFFDAGGAYCQTNFMAGYGNTTSAINAIDFKFASGNIDDGIIKMYGVAKA